MSTSRILPIGLFVCLSGAVLAFGGMEPVTFGAIEVVVFLLVGLALWGAAETKQLPWKGPTILLLYLIPHAFLVGSNADVSQEYLVRILSYLGVFCLAAVVARNQSTGYRLALALLGLGLFEAFYGLVQYLSGWHQIFTYEKVHYIDRATGTYINANHFAGFLGMVLPLSFSLCLFQFRTAEDTIRRRLPSLVFFFFTSLLLLVAILFSRSRMGIFSAGAALLMVGVLWVGTSWRRRAAGLALAGFLAAALLFGLWIGLGPVVERYERVGTDYIARQEIWRDTIDLIKERPVFGSGLGSYAHVYPSVQTTFLTRLVDHAHNDYLEITSEWGLLGAILLFGLITVVWIRAIRPFYRLAGSRVGHLALGCAGGVLALLVHGLADFNLQIPANAMVFATLIGLAHACQNGSTHRRYGS